MGELRFDTDGDEFARPANQNQGRDFTGMLVSWGIVSNRKQAEYVMMGLAVLIAIVAFFVYRSIPS